MSQKFVSQRNLVNVSLSAVNLFLNVADQVEDIKEVCRDCVSCND